MQSAMDASTLLGAEEPQTGSTSSIDSIYDDTYRTDVIQEKTSQLCVEGAPASTMTRTTGKPSPRKQRNAARQHAAGSRRNFALNKLQGSIASNNNDESTEWAAERQHLLDELNQMKFELSHAHNEKLALEESFRRLDREVADGYNLSARKANELRIAELVAKNQKLSEVLDKELKELKEARLINAGLVQERDSLHQRLDLVQRALTLTETKLNDIINAHDALSSRYLVAQEKIESLQGEVNDLQEKLVSSSACSAQIAEYENKLRLWEHKCQTLEQSLNESSQQALDQQQTVDYANREVEEAHCERARMEAEVSDAHDKLIHMTAALRAAEAKLELDIQHGDGTKQIEMLNNRIRLLEADLNEKTRAYMEVKHAFNELLSESPDVIRRNGTKARGASRGQPQEVSRSSSRVTALTDKICRIEESRDRANRALGVLMQSLPSLMRQLDDLSDKYQGACESNAILKSAIEQMQASWVSDNGCDPTPSPFSYLCLARQKFALETPLSTKLLSEISPIPVLIDYVVNGVAPAAVLRGKRPKASFSPFRTVMVSNKINSINPKPSDNQSEDLESGDGRVMALSADPEDSSGETYLNRSKINVFLQLAQGSAAKKKCKALLISKLAEYMSKNRDLTWRAKEESSALQTGIQLLTREVDDLKSSIQQLQQQQGQNNRTQHTHGEAYCDISSIARRQLLLKVIDLHAEKQQQQQESTFVTQTETGGNLLGCKGEFDRRDATVDGDVLSLRQLRLHDADLEQVLWKLKVSDARFIEVQLDDNNITDSGAQIIGKFLSSLPESIRVLSLSGVQRFSDLGIEEIRRGMAQNTRVHRVEMDLASSSLVALAATDSFDDSGQPTIIFRVVIPACAYPVSPSRKPVDLHNVDAFVEVMRQRGFASETEKKKRSSNLAANTPNSKSSSVRRQVTTPLSLACATRLTSTSRQTRVPKSRQQLKLQALEDALRNASSPEPRPRLRTSTTLPAHVMFTTPYAQALSKRSTSGPLVNSRRLGVDSAGRTHISTVRRLRR